MVLTIKRTTTTHERSTNSTNNTIGGRQQRQQQHLTYKIIIFLVCLLPQWCCNIVVVSANSNVIQRRSISSLLKMRSPVRTATIIKLPIIAIPKTTISMEVDVVISQLPVLQQYTTGTGSMVQRSSYSKQIYLQAHRKIISFIRPVSSSKNVLSNIPLVHRRIQRGGGMSNDDNYNNITILDESENDDDEDEDDDSDIDDDDDDNDDDTIIDFDDDDNHDEATYSTNRDVLADQHSSHMDDLDNDDNDKEEEEEDIPIDSTLIASLINDPDVRVQRPVIHNIDEDNNDDNDDDDDDDENDDDNDGEAIVNQDADRDNKVNREITHDLDTPKSDDPIMEDLTMDNRIDINNHVNKHDDEIIVDVSDGASRMKSNDNSSSDESNTDIEILDDSDDINSNNPIDVLEEVINREVNDVVNGLDTSETRAFTGDANEVATNTTVFSEANLVETLPLVIDDNMRQVMIQKLNYRKNEVDQLKRDVAHLIVQHNLFRPSEGVPTHWLLPPVSSPREKYPTHTKFVTNFRRILIQRIMPAVIMSVVVITASPHISNVSKQKRQKQIMTSLVDISAVPTILSTANTNDTIRTSINHAETGTILPEDAMPLLSSTGNSYIPQQESHQSTKSLKPMTGHQRVIPDLDETWLDKLITRVENGLKSIF